MEAQIQEIEQKLKALNTTRLQATSVILTALAFMIESKCSTQNHAFKLCKSQREPEKCVQLGNNVTKCVDELLKQTRKTCQSSFQKYYRCLEMNNHDFKFCRDEEDKFNDCARKMGYEKKLWKENGPHEVKDSLDIERRYFQYKYHVYRNKNC